MSKRRKDEHPLALILAGGRGNRLFNLTDNRSKPAVPFGKHSILNFALSNIINSNIINHAYVLTQYKQQGILDILSQMNFESPAWDKFIRPLPAQQQMGNDWYLGSANAVHQNHQYIENDPAAYVLILAADHIYKFDFEQLLEEHISNKADVTVSGMFLATELAANNFGVMDVDESGNIHGFKEKPAHPKQYPGKEDQCVTSQGIYLFNKQVLLEMLRNDHFDENSEHDFGKDIIPRMVKEKLSVRFYDHGTNIIPGEETTGYWRDVGTIDAFYQALMDQVQIKPDLDLYNTLWPITTVDGNKPMAKINSFGGTHEINCLLAGGAVITNYELIVRSVIGREVRIEEGAKVTGTILFDKSFVGKNSTLINCIVEEDIYITDDTTIGEDVINDESRNIHITENGIRVIHKGSVFNP